MCIGGEIMETSKSIILGSLRNIESLEWKNNIIILINKYTNINIYFK